MLLDTRTLEFSILYLETISCLWEQLWYESLIHHLSCAHHTAARDEFLNTYIHINIVVCMIEALSMSIKILHSLNETTLTWPY